MCGDYIRVDNRLCCDPEARAPSKVLPNQPARLCIHTGAEILVPTALAGIVEKKKYWGREIIRLSDTLETARNPHVCLKQIRLDMCWPSGMC